MAEGQRRQAGARSASQSAATGGNARRSAGDAASPRRSVRAGSAPGRRVSRSSKEQASRRPPVRLVVLLAVLLAATVFAAQLCSSAASITVTVNGTPYELRGDKTLEVAIKESGLPINPGDLISLGGTVLQRRAGNPFSATVNGEPVDDVRFKLRDGDAVTLADGADAVEPYDAEEQPVPYEVDVRGTGPIRTFAPGEDGVKEIRTGQISGEVVEKQTVEPTDLKEMCEQPSVGDAKMVALTFDGGPSTEFTEDILDVLAENGAKATFFCAGSALDDGAHAAADAGGSGAVDGGTDAGESGSDADATDGAYGADADADAAGQAQTDGAQIVQRALEEGHQICSHGYDRAAVAGGELSELTAEELVSEVERGFRALSSAIEGYSDRTVRLGSEPMGKDEVLAVAGAGLIDAEIGWTLDTGDWVYMGEGDIYDVLMSVQPGDIVRMHDGGDHQDATAKALVRALPKLKKKGFSFVTIDELRGIAADSGSN